MVTGFTKLIGTMMLAGIATASSAQSVSVASPAQYGMGDYLSDEQYKTKQLLRDRCLNEERTGRFSGTCKSYKRDLNRLLKAKSPA
jgi:hypothetical protein